MEIQSLYLQNFRLYEEALFKFQPGLNTIYGLNAQGKTTILEALFFLISGRSFRTSHTKDLIQYEKSQFYLEALFKKNEVIQKIRILFSEKEKKIYFNQTPCSSLASIVGLVQGVIMLPGDVELIKGGPQARRQFLDLQIAQVDPLYLYHLMRYQRAMKQRNALLKSQNFASMDCWEYEMALSAQYISLQRHKVLEQITDFTEKHYQKLFQEPVKIELIYKVVTKENDYRQENFLEQFKRYRKRDVIFGSTSIGPHKDEVLILINGKEAKFFASEGQQRGCVMALRLAEWERMALIIEDKPLLLIDDIGLNLDEVKNRYLYKLLQELGQCFTTSTQKSPVKFRNIDQAIEVKQNHETRRV